MKPYAYPLYTPVPTPADMRELTALFDTYGDKPAISYRVKASDAEKVTLSYRTVARDIRAMANACYEHGMAGKHCAVIGSISYDWIILYYALQTMGAVVVPLDRDWRGEDLVATAEAADCSVFFTDPDVREKLSLPAHSECYLMTTSGADSVTALRESATQSDTFPGEAPDPRALSLLVFTSGTTGKGKGVMLSQGAVTYDVSDGLRLIHAPTKCIMTLPPHHTYGSTIGFVALMTAGMEIYLSSGLKHLQREMMTEKPDLMVLVPLFIETFIHRIEAAIEKQKKTRAVKRAVAVSRALRKVGIDLRRKLFTSVLSAFGGNLSLIVSGGAPLRPEFVTMLDDFGISLLNGYGITECAPLIAANRNKSCTANTVGFPLPSLSVKIDRPDAAGNGEICVRGDNVMLGYYRDPEATDAVFDAEGYFHTGDIGTVDKSGRLVISGRSKNLIILPNGKNVYPEEIETELAGIHGVSDVVVYEGVSRRGITHNAIVAEFYPLPEFSGGKSAEELERHFRAGVDAYNRTAVAYKKVDIVRVRTEDFPKNTLRKIMRFKIDTTID